MSPAVLQQLLKRVEGQITRFSLPDFMMLLHGGEPLLWGVENFDRIAEECRGINERTGANIELSVTTNGILIDDAWLDCFEQNGFQVTLSIDGPAHIHDVKRRTFQGGPTHALVAQAVRQLQDRAISFGVLAVCTPAYHAKEYVDFFTSVGISDFDIMFPDATFEDRPPNVSRFYCDLFDIWFAANRNNKVLSIRSIENMIAGLVGGYSKSEEIGYGPQEVCTILTDGSMEPLDVLRIAGDESTKTAFSIFDHELEDAKVEPRWKAAREASLSLCEKCRRCEFVEACGGGYLPHRFSKLNGYDNPSVYCSDLIEIFRHMQAVLGKHVFVTKPSGERIAIGEAIGAAESRQPEVLPQRLHAR
jgi:uncharacterized protein